MIQLLLTGQPISVNRMYRGRRFMTSEGASMKEDFGVQAYQQYRNEPLMGKLEVSVIFHFDDNRRHDIDNCLKAVFDCLTGILWGDDSQIYKLHVEKIIGEKAMVAVSVEEIR